MKIVKESLSDKLKGPSEEEIIERIDGKNITYRELYKLMLQLGINKFLEIFLKKNLNPKVIEILIENLILEKERIQKIIDALIKSKINNKFTGITVELISRYLTLDELRKFIKENEIVGKISLNQIVRSYSLINYESLDEVFDFTMELIQMDINGEIGNNVSIMFNSPFFIKLLNRNRIQDLEWLLKSNYLSDETIIELQNLTKQEHPDFYNYLKEKGYF